MEADDIEMENLGRQEEAEAAARQIYQDEDDETFFDSMDPVDTIVPDDPVQETSFIDQGARPKELPPPLNDPRIREKMKILQSKVDDFYDSVVRKKGYSPEGGYIDYLNFDVEDGKLFLKGSKGLVQLTQEKDPSKFYSLSTLEGRNKIGSIAEIREMFNIPDYRRSPEVIKAIQNIEREIPNDFESIPLDSLPGITNNVLETFKAEGTQTTLTAREMGAIEKSMTNIRDELGNNLSKLSRLDEELGKERVKLEQAQKDNDQYEISEVSDRIKDYEIERNARIEVINQNKDSLRSQFNRIKETFQKIVHEDKTLMERVKTLFREQGVTIVSILTAIGMVIGVIVEAVLPSGTAGPTPTPTPKPSDPTGVKDWIKKQLDTLGKLLAKLAGKAASALPGIIGAIVSWLLSATGKVVNWLANNLWALLVFVSGLLFVAAKKYIYKK